MTDDFKKGFLKTLAILREYLPQVVIGGGWAPLVYYHYLLGKKEIEPIRTRDIDLFVPERVQKVGSQTIDQLLTQAGFQIVFKSHDTPPAVSYEAMIDDTEVEIEFLTHQKGLKEDVTIEVQRGLKAQALRFAAISIENAIEVEIDDFPVDDKMSCLKVRVPSPGAYIFHKGLVFVRRQREEKKAKDLYYIFDILANCPELEEGILTELSRLKTTYPGSWLRTFFKNLEGIFAEVSSEGVRLVLSQRPAEALRDLNDEQFRQYVCGIFQRFLTAIQGL